ncbi:hypothetical protein [Psychromonas sp. Urea-02u-13]|nr:hypothetical protein [Psychromonas sp. Urea-02u-13]
MKQVKKRIKYFILRVLLVQILYYAFLMDLSAGLPVFMQQIKNWS